MEQGLSLLVSSLLYVVSKDNLYIVIQFGKILFGKQMTCKLNRPAYKSYKSIDTVFIFIEGCLFRSNPLI